MIVGTLLADLFTAAAFDSMSSSEQEELLRSLRRAIDDRLYEIREDAAVFEESAIRRGENESRIRKGGVELSAGVLGLAIEVLDYHAGRTFIPWEEFDVLLERRG